MSEESLGTAVLTLATDSTKLKAGIADAQKSGQTLTKSFEEVSAKALGVGKDGKVSLETLNNAFKDPVGSAKSLAMGLGEQGVTGSLSLMTVGITVGVGAVVALGAAMVSAAFHAAEVGASLNDASEITGISVERLSGLRFAALASGGSLEQLTNVVFKMQQRMEENPKQFNEGLARLKINAEEFAALTLDEKVLRISKAFREVGPGADQGLAALELFSRQGRDFIPILNKDLEGLVQQSKDLGMTWSEEDAAAAEELEKQSHILHETWSNIWDGIGNMFIPMLSGLGQAIMNRVKDFQDFRVGIAALFGEFRNMPKEIKEPKIWTDLADRGVKPVALSFDEAKDVIKEMDKALKDNAETVKKNKEEFQKLAAEKTEVSKTFSDIGAAVEKLQDQIEEETRKMAADVNGANLAWQRGLELIHKYPPELVELQGAMHSTGMAVNTEAEGTFTAVKTTTSVIVEMWNAVGNSITGNLVGMLTGVQSFSEGMKAIWHNLLTELVGSFVNGFIKNIFGTLTGAQPGVTAGLGGMFSGLKGVLGGMSSALSGWVGWASAAIAGIAAAWHAISGLIHGGEEGQVVNPAREQWFDAHGGLEGVNTGLMNAGLSWEDAESLVKAVFAAHTASQFTEAAGNVERALHPINLPGLAEGGLVRGPMTANLAENGPELVLPLDRLNLGRTLEVPVYLNRREIARAVVQDFPSEVGAFV